MQVVIKNKNSLFLMLTYYFLSNTVDFYSKKHTNFMNNKQWEILPVWRKMNKRIFFWSIKQNIAIIIGAACVALGIFFVTKNPNILMASVLSLQEKKFIAAKWRDIAYKTNSWYVDIFMSEKLETPKNIDISISFNKDTVTIDTKNLSWQGTRTVKNPDENNVIIQSTPEQTVDKSQSIVLLPFTGEIKDILLSEAVANLNDGSQKNLSIGSLNTITTHSK